MLAGMYAPPCLHTDHLRLRPPTVEDRALGETLHRDPLVRQYLGGPTPEEHLPDVLAGYLTFSPRRAAWVVRLADGGEAIGLVTVSEHKDGEDVELSYLFAPSAWGQGYATEATRAVLDYGAAAMGLQRIIAETQQANAPSRRLLERLGMTPRASLIRFGAPQVIYELPLDGAPRERPERGEEHHSHHV